MSALHTQRNLRERRVSRTFGAKFAADDFDAVCGPLPELPVHHAQGELSEINTLKEEIIQKNDPAKIKETRKKISDYREAFRAYATKMEELDKYVGEGLARPDLTNKEVFELDHLRDEANKARMAVRAAGDLLKAFPE